MTTIESHINYDKCHLDIKCQNMEYSFTFSLDRFNLQRVQELVQKFRSLAHSVGGNHEDDEFQEINSIVFVSHTSDYNHVFSLIEHLCEDDYSLGYLRFEQRIDMAEYVNFSETNFIIQITEENRDSIASDLQTISNEIESYMRRESRHLQFDFVPHQSMYRSPAPSSPVTPSAPMASRQMSMSPQTMTPQQLFNSNQTSPQVYHTPTPSSPQQPSAPMANRQMSFQPMTPQQLFLSSPQQPSAPMANRQMSFQPMTPQQLFRSPQVTPSAPMANRYPQQRSSEPMSQDSQSELFRDN